MLQGHAYTRSCPDDPTFLSTRTLSRCALKATSSSSSKPRRDTEAGSEERALGAWLDKSDCKEGRNKNGDRGGEKRVTEVHCRPPPAHHPRGGTNWHLFSAKNKLKHPSGCGE